MDIKSLLKNKKVLIGVGVVGVIALFLYERHKHGGSGAPAYGDVVVGTPTGTGGLLNGGETNSPSKTVTTSPGGGSGGCPAGSTLGADGKCHARHPTDPLNGGGGGGGAPSGCPSGWVLGPNGQCHRVATDTPITVGGGGGNTGSGGGGNTGGPGSGLTGHGPTSVF